MTLHAMTLRAAGASAIALLVAGCASTGGMVPAATTLPANRLVAERTLASAQVSAAAWPRTDWWTAFGDAQLNQLMDEAFADSPTLRIAAARARRALAAADQSKAALYPQINAALDISRQRFSETGLIPPPFAGSWATEHDLRATLDWEIDFWGKNRAGYERALGEARAAEVDAAAAKLALSVDIAHAYVALQRTFGQLDIARTTLGDRERIAALTRERNAAGVDSRLELKQAEGALPAMRVDIAALEETIALLRNQLSALVGQGPDRGLAIVPPRTEMPGGAALPTNVPAELLGRRPDLVALRERIESAQQGIAEAKAQFYPNVNLLMFIGLQSLSPSGFLTAASRVAGVGPAVTLPIFEGGRLRANLAQRDADFDIAVERYNATLIDALRDVVDQLASLKSLDEQRRQQAQALADASEAYDLALARYREGIGNYLQVLSAEAPLLIQRSRDVDLQSRQRLASVDLIRALGGGVDMPVVHAAAGSP